MQITIDTKRDSKEEIKEAIRFLQQLVAEQFSPEFPDGDNVFGSMLDAPADNTPEKNKEEEEFSLDKLQTY
ncbi:hypothetical protein KY320_03640 [Candidatus Woesearchaeota archaeon]|nr:hypothetical protein [Candidatus Woesearchaeota archaeon]